MNTWIIILLAFIVLLVIMFAYGYYKMKHVENIPTSKNIIHLTEKTLQVLPEMV